MAEAIQEYKWRQRKLKWKRGLVAEIGSDLSGWAGTAGDKQKSPCPPPFPLNFFFIYIYKFLIFFSFLYYMKCLFYPFSPITINVVDWIENDMNKKMMGKVMENIYQEF